MFAADDLKSLSTDQIGDLAAAIRLLDSHKVLAYFEERVVSSPSGSQTHDALIEYGKALGRHEVIGQLRHFMTLVVVPLKTNKPTPITYGAITV